jgi:hypothetical protein
MLMLQVADFLQLEVALKTLIGMLFERAASDDQFDDEQQRANKVRMCCL